MNFSRNKIFNLKVCWIEPFISGFLPNSIEHQAWTGQPHCLLQWLTDALLFLPSHSSSNRYTWRIFLYVPSQCKATGGTRTMLPTYTTLLYSTIPYYTIQYSVHLTACECLVQFSAVKSQILLFSSGSPDEREGVGVGWGQAAPCLAKLHTTLWGIQ